jgi:hypothetical protein
VIPANIERIIAIKNLSLCINLLEHYGLDGSSLGQLVQCPPVISPYD